MEPTPILVLVELLVIIVIIELMLFVLCKLGKWRRHEVATEMVKYWINNIFGNIETVFFKPATQTCAPQKKQNETKNWEFQF